MCKQPAPFCSSSWLILSCRYLSDVISRQDHESAMAEAATAHALKTGEAAVNAEQEQQALAKELAVTLSAHSSEMERARKVDLLFTVSCDSIHNHSYTTVDTFIRNRIAEGSSCNSKR